MKKIFTLATAVLASFSLWAATESNPTSDVSSSNEVSGTSYTIDGNYVAGLGGTKAGDMVTKGIKFRLNKTVGELSNAVEFKVNAGYVITKIDFCGQVNDGSKTSTITQVLVDGVDINAAPVNLPVKTSSVSFSYTINATESFIMVFAGSGTQANIEYTITYEEAVQKEVDHVVKTLTGAAINGVTLSDLQMATLYGALSLDLTNEYAEAPTVTFTVQTDTYYVGEETPSTKSEDIDVVAALNPDGKWQAQQTVGEQTYTITAVKPATATVTYMDGETVLGTETVKVGESATKHGEYEVKPLAEFQGWYTNAELTSEANLSATVGADMILYAKFVKAYATSLNIEQYILDNGRNNADQDHIGEAFAAVLSGAGYAYSNLNALDTLNDLENKENRNYAFLGLKMKTAGASIQFNLQAGKTLAVKFGNLPKPIAVTIDGVAQANHTEGAFLLEAAEADRLIELKTTDKSTVVLQQIMIGEAIADVTLPDPGAYAITLSAENGTLEAAWEGKTEKKVNVPVGETVTLTVTPAEGYKLETITVNEVALEAVEGVYSFTMPAQAANVVATFVAESATGINNTEEAVKAVKVIRNGQLFIEKNGVLFNAQGAVVK